MKRKSTILAAMILATSMIATPVYAADTAGLDLDSMSVEDLVSLRDTINAKIGEKGGDNVLPEGKYEVGKDIKAGNFKIMCCAGYESAIVYVFTSKEEEDQGNADQHVGVTLADGDSGVINLENGEIVSVVDASVVIENVSDASWVPDKDETTDEASTESDSSETKDNTSTDIRPEIKESIDSYESFMNEYCDFMEKYDESDDVVSMLKDYTSYMAKYADFTKKFDELDDSDLNDAELAYYLEVQNRVNQRLLSVSEG